MKKSIKLLSFLGATAILAAAITPITGVTQATSDVATPMSTKTGTEITNDAQMNNSDDTQMNNI